MSNHTPAPPLVSIIIPAFNYGHFMEGTLDSVRAQTLGDWECIIVDDGSTDDTAAIVTAAVAKDSRIRLIGQHNQGQASARNAGLRAARGKYVQLLDADDLIESEKLRRQSDFLEQHDDVDIVYGSVRYFPNDRPQERRFSLLGHDVPWMSCISGAGPEIALALLEMNIMVINSPLVRRTTLDDVGGFDDALPRADDWDMWLRCALAGKKFAYRDEPGTRALVRAHLQSLTRRDCRLISARVAIHRNVTTLTSHSRILRRNAELLEWLTRIDGFARRLDELIAPKEPFVLIDDEMIRPELLGYRATPFTERDGEYDGPPMTADQAIREIERLRAAGATSVVIAWPAMWQLQFFPAFCRHLEKSYPCILRCQDTVIFDLRASAARC